MNLLALIFILLGWLWWVAIFPYPESGISSAGYSFVLPLVASFLLIFSTIVSFLAGRRNRGERDRAHH
jgi:polyferredoxin